MAKVEVTNPNTSDIQLLTDEKGGLGYEEGITTMTYYTGDINAAKEALRNQFKKVVEKNPWIAGRLVSHKVHQMVLQHPSEIKDSDIEGIFKTNADDTDTDGNDNLKLDETLSYKSMCTDLFTNKKYVIGTGPECLKKKSPITCLSILKTITKGKFVVIFSMSHTVADGKTYYDIYKMLQPGAIITSLDSTRIHTFKENMLDNCGRKELEWIESTSGMCVWLCPTLPFPCGPLFKKGPVKNYAFYIDTVKLEEEKKKYADSNKYNNPAGYVSTNDIITSGFFNAVDARIGFMGLDCRNRIPGIKDNLAGNYVSALMLDNTKYETPVSIRQMLSSPMPYETTGRPLPGCFSVVCGGERCNFAMVTNWSSFAGGLIQLENCQMNIHLPIQNPASAVFDLMIPFASGVGKVGVMIWTISTDEEGLRRHLPVGELISKDLFP